MNKLSDIRLLLILMSFGFVLNFLLGIVGFAFPQESFWQMTCWQIGDASAIMASILASRYVGTKGWHVVPAGFTLLGIAYGVSFASSAFNGVIEEKMAMVILPLLPALLLISMGNFFPVWVRLFSALICIPFFLVYYSVITGTYSFDSLANALAYMGLQLIGVIWTYFIWRNYKSTLPSAHAAKG